jgi:hypothetical protein
LLLLGDELRFSIVSDSSGVEQIDIMRILV